MQRRQNKSFRNDGKINVILTLSNVKDTQKREFFVESITEISYEYEN